MNQNMDVVIKEDQLTQEQQVAVDACMKEIDLTDANMVLQYGGAAQNNIAEFSTTTLEKVRTKDMGEVGEMITDLVGELKGFKVGEEPKGLMGLFKKGTDSIANLKIKYDKAENNVEKICEVLEGHQVMLLKDISMIDRLYEMNVAYYKDLTIHIVAGKKKLEEVNATVIPELKSKAEASGFPEDAQALNDFVAMVNRFEKKLADLDITRMVSIQMAPQMRLLQNNQVLMAEKIQTSLVNTIPLWKSQMVLALGMEHARQAMEAQRQVSDMTNELLKKNADMLKMGTIETAKESERSIIDIETLKHTNESLISTLDEVLQIQREGSQKRKEAEMELRRIESELKTKLLSVRQ